MWTVMQMAGWANVLVGNVWLGLTFLLIGAALATWESCRGEDEDEN